VLEPGFLTNPDDARRLSDPETHRVIAEAVVEGLTDFLTGRS